MKRTIKALSATLTFGLGLLVAGCNGGKQERDATTLEAIRADLKEQVAEGELSAAEAQVQLAEAFAEAKAAERAEAAGRHSAELETLGAELKGQVETGELTAEEAKAKWIEAKKQIGAKAKGEEAKEQERTETDSDTKQER